jgi:hypothetical protein
MMSSCIGNPGQRTVSIIVAGSDVTLELGTCNVGPRAVLLRLDGAIADPLVEQRATDSENACRFAHFESEQEQRWYCRKLINLSCWLHVVSLSVCVFARLSRRALLQECRSPSVSNAQE